MNSRLATALFLMVALTIPAFAQKGARTPDAKPLKTAVDSTSYSIGLQIGRNLKSQPMDLNAETLAAGVLDGLTDKARLTDEQMQALLMAAQEQLAKKQQAALASIGEENKKAGAAFLAENGKRPGVVTLPSGLQYEIITPGTGAKPTANDRVTVHYRGTLLDGRQFDASYDRGQPATFQLNQVIPGWTEGLQQMAEGAKAKLYIPSDLGYGPGGQPGSPIGPNSMLVFEVELIKVN